MGLLQLFKRKEPQQDNISIQIIERLQEENKRLSEALLKLTEQVQKNDEFNRDLVRKIYNNITPHTEQHHNEPKQRKEIKIKNPSPTEQILIDYLEEAPNRSLHLDKICEKMNKDRMTIRALQSKINKRTAYSITTTDGYLTLQE